jgi:hypothetical protein
VNSIVRVRAVQQVNQETEEVNLTMTLDQLTPTQEFKVDSGSWRECEPANGEVFLIGNPDTIKALLDKEFRSV